MSVNNAQPSATAAVKPVVIAHVTHDDAEPHLDEAAAAAPILEVNAHSITANVNLHGVAETSLAEASSASTTAAPVAPAAPEATANAEHHSPEPALSVSDAVKTSPAPHIHPHGVALPPAHNVVFFSPQFPSWVTPFAVALGRFPNVNVLGIGDEPYDALPQDLKDTLTEYYRVDSLENYADIQRAVGFFTHKYGKIDRFESLNEHWLELESDIRQDFNIAGPKPEFIENVRRKSKMKDVFKAAGVATIQGTVVYNLDEALNFARCTEYPLVVKPDSGSGATATYRVNNEWELTEVFHKLPANTGPVVVEQYMDAIIISFDGLVDADGNIIFESSCQVDQSIMDVVNTGGNAYYVCLPYVPQDIKEAGTAIVKAYNLRERYFHIELFKRRDNGKVVGLEINLRPPGAWMTDGYNFALSTDVYQRWAAMVAGAEQPWDGPDRYFAPYASRKWFNHYRHNQEQIADYLGPRLAMHKLVEQVLAAAAGDEAYIAKAKSYDEALDIVRYIQDRV